MRVGHSLEEDYHLVKELSENESPKEKLRLKLSILAPVILMSHNVNIAQQSEFLNKSISFSQFLDKNEYDEEVEQILLACDLCYLINPTIIFTTHSAYLKFMLFDSA